jgi:hypothetical protein
MHATRDTSLVMIRRGAGGRVMRGVRRCYEFGGRMKKLLVMMFVMSVNTISLAQTPQPPEPRPEASVTQHRTVDLPLTKRNFRPKLPLQRALKLAESYAAKEKIHLSRYYLYQAKYTLYGSKDNQEPCWLFWWVNEDGALGNYVEIIVSIGTGNVRRLPSM